MRMAVRELHPRQFLWLVITWIASSYADGDFYGSVFKYIFIVLNKGDAEKTIIRGYAWVMLQALRFAHNRLLT